MPSAGLVLAALLFALTSTPGHAGALDPDKPRFHFWWRQVGERVVEVGDMHPDVERIADAFGRGEYEETRRLAETLAQSTDSPQLRGEAVSFLIEAYLSEGDFDSARAAAERFDEERALARLTKIGAEHRAEVSRLENMLANAKGDAEAAEARLLVGCAHEVAYRFGLAEESYWEVVRRYPEQPQAGRAIAKIARLRARRGNREAAMAACEEAVVLAPDSRAASGACRAMGALVRLNHDYEGGRQRLRQIADSHPGTWAFYASRLEIGRLYAVEGLRRDAEAEWAMLLSPGKWHPVLAEVAGRLSEIRREMAVSYVEEGRRDLAVEKLRLAVRNAQWEHRKEALHDLGQLAMASEDYETAKSAYEECLAVEEDRRRRQGLRYDIARCWQGLGVHRRAAEELRKLLDEGLIEEGLVPHCEFFLEISEQALERASHGEQTVPKSGQSY